MKVESDVDAWDFDMAITSRLQRHDNETQRAGAMRTALAVMAMWNGKAEELTDGEW